MTYLVSKYTYISVNWDNYFKNLAKKTARPALTSLRVMTVTRGTGQSAAAGYRLTEDDLTLEAIQIPHLESECLKLIYVF